jgi:hypothetical protein
MALSPIKSYYQEAKQIEAAYDDLTNFAKHGKMPEGHELYEVFSLTINLENLYAAAAQGLEGRKLQELAQSHNALRKKLTLGPSSTAISHIQKTSSASKSHSPSKPANPDAIIAQQVMTMVEDNEPLQEIAKVYIRMTATSQFRGYKLLCLANGGVVNDVLTEGKVHFVKNPKSLLKRVFYHGHTMRGIDHLIVKAGGKLLCLDVWPSISTTWKLGAEACTKEVIHNDLYSSLTMWNRNPEESLRTAENWESSKKIQRQLNKQIFCLVKAQTGVQTPMEFVRSLQGYLGCEPTKIGETALQFNPIEGQFYKLDHRQAEENKPPLKVPTQQYELVNETNDFVAAIKRKGNHLYLYLDGKSYNSTLINGMCYVAIGMGGAFANTRGCKEPSYRFKQGDVVCNYGGTYLFTVGKNGTIHYPGNEKNPYPTSSDAREDSKEFASSLATRFYYKKEESNRHAFLYTTRPRAAEWDNPLVPGFSVPSTPKDDEKAAIKEAEEDDYKKRGDLIFIDVPNDPVLKSLIAYLEIEFEVMQYTEAQKMMRIALLSADLLREDAPTSKFKGNNYLLGEIVRAGAGNAVHRSALNKVLCDAFKLPCAFICGFVDIRHRVRGGPLGDDCYQVESNVAIHAWTIIQADGRNYLVDSAKEIIFPLDNPPGTTTQAKKDLREYYGVRED